jgi:phage terminase large subunit-like protein
MPELITDNKQTASSAISKPNIIIHRPQPGPQEMYFQKYWCNVVIYGGAVFAGKTWALCYDALKDSLRAKGYEAKIFRRTFPQIIQSLIPTSRELYSGVKYNSYAEKPNPVFKFYDDPKKRIKRSEISFSHMQYDKTAEDHQGLQSPFIGFDELEHFSRYMFTYMFSRNRSRVKLPSNVNTQRIRATCNPLPGSWLAELLDQGGYIQADGYPDPEMKGKVRYMYNIEDEWVFGDDPVSLQNRYKKKSAPFSFTFVPGTLDDNQIGNENNPAYESALSALSSWDYDVLVRGNWKSVRQGSLFLREYFFTYVEDDITTPINITHKIITVDTAQGIGQKNDNTVFLLTGITPEGKLVLLDCLAGKFPPMMTYRIAEAFYLKHSKPSYNLVNMKTGNTSTMMSAPLIGMAIEYANRGVDLLMELKTKGYKVGPIKRQGKVAEGQRSNDKVARAISVLPKIKKAGIWMPAVPTRHSGYDQWCNADPGIQAILEPGETVCTDPKMWTLSMKSELIGFSQGADKKEVKGQHDDRVDVLVDAAQMLLGNKGGASWLKAMLELNE